MNIILNKTLIEKRNYRQHYFFSVGKEEIPPLTWDAVIECLNFNLINNIPIRIFPNFYIVLKNYNNINIIKKICDEVSLLDTSTSCSAHLYISLTEVSSTAGRHADKSDVLFWQSIGSTKWDIEENNKTYSYILNPNDFVYIPKHTYHTVTPLTPRVGVSFGLDY